MIEDTIIYKEATEVPPTSISSLEEKRPTIEEISKELSRVYDRESSEFKIHSLGEMYKRNITPRSTSSDVLLIILKCYYELLHKELEYNKDEKKIDLLKKTLSSIENLISILKDLKYECESSKIIILLRGLII